MSGDARLRTPLRALRLLGAAAIAAGLCLPYESCGVRPIALFGSDWNWGEQPLRAFASLGIPVIALALYVLVAAVSLASERAFRGLRRLAPAPVGFAILVSGALVLSALEGAEASLWIIAFGVLCAVALVQIAAGALEPSGKLPLALLATAAPAVVSSPMIDPDNLRWGGWLLTAGFLIAAGVEIVLARRGEST